MSDLQTLIAEPWADWGLIDCGNGQKLERYGKVTVVRPEPQAMWAPARDDWDPDATFVPGSDEEGGGRWVQHRPVPRQWELSRGRRPLPCLADAVPAPRLLSRHGAAMGLDARALGRRRCAQPVRLHGRRNAAAERCRRSTGPCRCVEEVGRAGQGQRAAVGHGKSDPIRWIVDDASKFTAREVRRGRRYDGILLDPPKFGRGPEGEVWRLEENLAPLLADCRSLLDANSRFLVLTVYAVRMSALAIGELVKQTFGDLGGTVEMGEMAVREEARGLLLPTAIFARWCRD